MKNTKRFYVHQFFCATFTCAMRIIFAFSLTILCLFLLSCDEKPIAHQSNSSVISLPNETVVNSNIPANAEEGRYAWQKPGLVIDKLGDLEGKVIADIGAGTGYFSFRLLSRAEKVIAVDIDQDMIDLIKIFRENLDTLSQKKIDTRLASSENPNLLNDEVDIALIINTIGYITDKSAYLNNLRSAIKEGGEVVIVDFKMKRIPDDIAPPSEYRVSILDLENLLIESGYKNVVTDDISLNYQYIVKASRE